MGLFHLWGCGITLPSSNPELTQKQYQNYFGSVPESEPTTDLCVECYQTVLYDLMQPIPRAMWNEWTPKEQDMFAEWIRSQGLSLAILNEDGTIGEG